MKLQLPKVEQIVELAPSGPMSHVDRARATKVNRRWARIETGLIVVLFVVTVLAWIQGDSKTRNYAAIGFVVAIIIFSATFVKGARYVGGWVVFSLAAALAWLQWGGSYNHLWDYGLLAACFLLLPLLFKDVRRWLRARDCRKEHPLRDVLGFRFSLCFLLCFWFLASVCDRVLQSSTSLPRDPGRFTALRLDSPYKDLNVGLALSGGGYRAAVMHAGVLDAFERFRVPVTHITSVSGGSVIGAFYAAGGRPADFRAAVADGRFNLGRELTNFFNAARLVSPMQIPWTKTKILPTPDFARTDVQAELLDRVLLDHATFTTLEHKDAPRLMVCATDLYTGAAVGVSKQGVLRRFMIRPGEKDDYKNMPPPSDDDRCAYVPAGDAGYPSETSLAHVVAASGAFPGAFNAVHEKIAFEKGTEPRQLLLADGGLSDNSALTVMAFANARANWNIDVAVSSDASALFNERKDIEALGEVTRAVDIVYANLGVRRDPQGSCPVNKSQLLLTPGKYLTPAGDKVSALDRFVADAVASLSPGGRPDAEAFTLACDLLAAAGRAEADALRPALGGDGPDARVARERLSQLLAAELNAGLDAFTQAATLEDHFEPEVAGRLYRLGQLLVVLDWGSIEPVLEARLKEKTTPRGDNVARLEAPARARLTP